MASFHLISLGCAKNLVDSEVMLGSLLASGEVVVDSPEQADVLVINTCGFIQPAVEEAVEEILTLVEEKKRSPAKKIIVTGCLVQRYREQLLSELPEVDLFIGSEGAADLAGLVKQLSRGEFGHRLVLPERFLMSSATPRVMTTPPFRAWLKITEGCNNRCSYCMIPMIRGPLRSRPIDDLVREAQILESQGVKELSLIAQDSTAYGHDLGGGVHLVRLLLALLDQTAIPWIRLLYLHPKGVDDQLLALIAANPRLLPYLDIPMQHVSERILRAMNRHYGPADLERLLAAIQQRIPEAALRTTFLVGFPGEQEEDFLQVADFMHRHRLHHVGVFAYSNEEGAPSANFTEQVPEAEGIRRRDHLLEVQAEISAHRQEEYLGRTVEVLVEGVCPETELLLIGRTRFQAPEVDGCVYINEGIASAGEIVQVRISETQVYDLVGGVVVGEDLG
ncbi:MAG: 30S ribosomal protein S12 methylthiotransferase RimO [Desulforhopalus sp.]|jgi:ribosomal protein S12 methylthiotransferase|nr:30S ribosomal protein S12 methylthiotransferase RimO [Desulforhopalus sp.]